MLQVREQALGNGTLILDFGTKHTGTLSGGQLLAKICMADLAEITWTTRTIGDWELPAVQVSTDCPLLACMASQYAGWPVQSSDYYAMGSGPARLLRGQEPLLVQHQWSDVSHQVLVLESAKFPKPELANELAAACGVDADQLTLCIARTSSFPGAVQIVARCIETTLHKLFELQFPLQAVISAIGNAPLPPLGQNDLQAIGRTNDAILYGAVVTLWVDCEDSEIESICPRLPSSSSPDFGRPFLEIFESYGRDFYQVDKALFSPACVMIHNVKSGRVFRFGEVHAGILRKSFALT
jgi:methenyltetrahydromethanopterin cyclohydrolase